MLKVERRKRKRIKRRRIRDKEKVIKAMDSLVLTALGKDEFRNFKDYKEEMEDFTFDSVFGGMV